MTCKNSYLCYKLHFKIKPIFSLKVSFSRFSVPAARIISLSFINTFPSCSSLKSHRISRREKRKEEVKEVRKEEGGWGIRKKGWGKGSRLKNAWNAQVTAEFFGGRVIWQWKKKRKWRLMEYETLICGETFFLF